MEQSREPTGEAATKSAGGIRNIVTIALALVIGFGVGRQFIGPAFAASGGEHAEEEPAGDDGHGGGAATSLIFTLDGIIVNPAGSRGRNHLIVTVAYKVKSAADEAKLRGSEVMLRDAVASMLERKSIDVLTSPGIREDLRSELAAIVAPYLKGGSVEVYLPQFIVQ